MITQSGLNYLKAFYNSEFYTTASYTATVTKRDGTTTTTTLPYSSNSSYKTAGWRPAGLESSTSSGIYSGSVYYVTNGTNVFYGNNSTTNLPTAGVIFGDGNIEPAVTDYDLSGNQFTDFTADTAVTCNISNGKILITGTYNITNTGASPFTIKEIGVLLPVSFTGVARWLFSRDLLATPVTIQPGDTGVVTYKIEIS